MLQAWELEDDLWKVILKKKNVCDVSLIHIRISQNIPKNQCNRK